MATLASYLLFVAVILAGCSKPPPANPQAKTEATQPAPAGNQTGGVEYSDQALSELAEMFISFPVDPTPGHELLSAADLDYSVESLAKVNAFLDRMRGRELELEPAAKLRLRAGAYVGEVIRRHSQPGITWHWVDRDQAIRLEPRIASFGVSIDFMAVLWDADREVAVFPVGKVSKYIENGAEDDLEFFARWAIAGPANR